MKVAVAYAKKKDSERVRRKWNGGIIEADETLTESAKEDDNEKDFVHLFSKMDHTDFAEYPAESLKEEPHATDAHDVVGDEEDSLAKALRRRRQLGRG